MDPIPAAQPQQVSTRNNTVILLFIGIGILACALIVMIIMLIRQPGSSIVGSNQSAKTNVSGVLDVNGVVPVGATITLTAQDINGGPVQIFASGLTPVDNDSWSFANAVASKSYTIKAQVLQGVTIIAESSPINVTAPADDEKLSINIQSTPAVQKNAVISGNIIVNGYIPSGATITVDGRLLGAQSFSHVATSLPGQARQFMSYTTAIAGKEYEVRGVLLAADGSTIGTSSILTVAAPALGETLEINSSALPPATPTPTPTLAPAQATPTVQASTPTSAPAQPAVISGSINLNGIAPANSRIVIFQKPYNSSSYQVAVDNITPSDNGTWQWVNPKASTWYDMIAILKQRQQDGTDKDISTSSMKSVAAPAAGVIFTLNSGFSLNPPSGPISVACGNLSGSTWFATVSFGAVSGAGSYWYEIGTSNGGVEVSNSTQNANGNSPITAQVQFSPGRTYYARYAYSTLQNQAAGGSQFSPFTQTTPLQCN